MSNKKRQIKIPKNFFKNLKYDKYNVKVKVGSTKRNSINQKLLDEIMKIAMDQISLSALPPIKINNYPERLLKKTLTCNECDKVIATYYGKRNSSGVCTHCHKLEKLKE